MDLPGTMSKIYKSGSVNTFTSSAGKPREVEIEYTTLQQTIKHLKVKFSASTDLHNCIFLIKCRENVLFACILFKHVMLWNKILKISLDTQFMGKIYVYSDNWILDY